MIAKKFPLMQLAISRRSGSKMFTGSRKHAVIQPTRFF